MILLELFDDSYAFTTTKRSEAGFGEWWHCDFKTHDHRAFTVAVSPVGGGEVKVAFFEEADGDLIMHTSGLGDAYRVFATVLAVMGAYVEEHHPTKMIFDADNDEPSRVTLYRKIVLRKPPKGYHAEVPVRGEGFTQFTFTRNDVP
jgi:hypothetical protein